MTRFYKKGPLGMVKAEAGMSDPDAAEVRMSMKEYRGLLDDIQSAEKSAASARAMAEDRIAGIREKAKEKIEEARRQAEAESDRKVEEARNEARKYFGETKGLKKQLEEANEIIKNEKHLNENLTRIMRERANQVREIRPKKKHDGYLVLRSRQWYEQYSVTVWDTEDHMIRYAGNSRLAIKKGYLRMEKRRADVWKSTLQTPYDASIPLEQIKYRVEEEELWHDGNGILSDIGCPHMVENNVNGKYAEFERDTSTNRLYKWIFEANYKSGFWELEIYTTKALTVPEHRRPPQRIKGSVEKTQKITRKMKREDATAEAESFFAEFDDIGEEIL